MAGAELIKHSYFYQTLMAVWQFGFSNPHHIANLQPVMGKFKQHIGSRQADHLKLQKKVETRKQL
jgi:hypothetical protein